MKKTIKTLAKELNFNSTSDYYYYLIECHINGNFSSCEKLFNEMKKADQKDFIMYLNDNEDLKGIRNFYFNLL